MLVKALIILMMLLILLSLASAVVYLVKDQGRSKRTVKALSWRIGLSLTLFILLMLAFATGLIEPHAL